MNLFAPPEYDERIIQLALGVEPRDALLGTRASGLRVTIDQHPKPLHIWRSWPPGIKLDDVLPVMDRHASGRYLLLLSAKTADSIRLRLTDRSRRYVPRRFEIGLPNATTVTAATRIFRPLLHPGAGNEFTGTVVGGRVRNAAGRLVRWVRAEAIHHETGASLGWAHGDDRGEFVLPITNAIAQVGFAADPLPVDITVGFAASAPEAPKDDPLTSMVDPIWDLPEEKLPSLPNDVIAGGRQFLGTATHNTHTFPTVQLALGRTRFLTLDLP
jgi:hypothetical protein